MAAVLVDTGAWVALLERSDGWHERAVEVFRLVRPPVLICEAVLAEALRLIGGSGSSRRALAELHKRQIIRIMFNFEAEAAAVWHLLQKDSDVPMDLADACLVRMTEIHTGSRIWTVDSDFRFYRWNGRQMIPLIFPTQKMR
jgi:predicted nucleic acid-binding protein